MTDSLDIVIMELFGGNDVKQKNPSFKIAVLKEQGFTAKQNNEASISKKFHARRLLFSGDLQAFHKKQAEKRGAKAGFPPLMG